MKISASFAALIAVLFASPALADGTTESVDLSAEIKALKLRIAELEAKQHENWLTQERTAQIRAIVEDVIADARKRGQFADGPDMGYNNGFFFQTADKRFKVVFNGVVQARYEFLQANATNGRTISNHGGVVDDPGSASGFDIRRARLSLSGNAFSPDLTFKLEGDFYGSASGGFTVVDAFLGYRFNDQFRLRAGAFKVPFAKTQLVSGTALTFMERTEVLAPFNPARALGVSLHGDIIKDQLSYELNANDGGNSSTLRRVSTLSSSSLTSNLDNRMSFYTRLQWAGSGKIADFADESDLRNSKKPRPFIWMLGGAFGYESQNSSPKSFPAPQTGTPIQGGSNGDGFVNGILNGDVFRGTIDWSAKYSGWSFIAAAYFQQFNQDSTFNLPLGYAADNKTSFFQHAYYGQIGYFIIPDKLELAGRAGFLLNDGSSNLGEFYSLGANYYVYGNNLKLSSDVSYTPEAAYTDAASSLIQNTHGLVFRVQAQLKF